MAKKILSVCFLMSFLSGWAQVGIGTTAPEASLDIRAANHLGAVTAKDGILIPRVANLSVNGSTDGQLIYLTTSTASYTKGFHYWDSGVTRWIPLNSTVEPWYKVNTTEPATSNTDDIYIMGKVGIGSSNPIEHIEIKREGDNDMQFTSANANPPNVIFYNTGGTLAAPKLLNDDQEIGSVVFKTYDGSSINEVGGIRMFMDGAPSRGSLPTKIVFNTTRQGAVNQTANPGAMTINNAGNVGIGIADPTARLHITNSLRYVDATPGDDNGKVLTSDANGNASWQVPAVTETRGVQYYSYDIASTASPNLIELKTNSRISKSGDYNGDLVYSSVFNPSNDEDGFVVKITGTYLVKKSGNFIFTQSSDDGARIYIDDVLILNDWVDSSNLSTSSPAILLSAGKHKFDFWYYENAGGQSFSFSWGTNPDGNSGVMKASQFTVE